jgi:hypothetical protein
MNLSEIAEFIEKLSFKNNQNLRPVGVSFPYTEADILEVAKCEADPIYFIENYIKVIHPDRGLVPMLLHGYQKRMVTAYHTNKQVVTMASRQLGKCCCINTKVKVRSKITNTTYELTLGEFYEWNRFKEMLRMPI